MPIEIDDPVTVEGMVTQFGLSGLGPNSGEFTLGVMSDGEKFAQVFGGIMDFGRTAKDGLEHGVFAAFVSIASIAYSTKTRVRCTYRSKDKNRVTGLELLR